MQGRSLAGPRAAGQARPATRAGQMLQRLSLLPVQVLALAEHRLGDGEPGVQLGSTDLRRGVLLPGGGLGDVDHVPLKLADLTRGHPAVNRALRSTVCRL